MEASGQSGKEVEELPQSDPVFKLVDWQRVVKIPFGSQGHSVF